MNVSTAHPDYEVEEYATLPIHYFDDFCCSYCGSLSPEKLAEAIKSGISVSVTDMRPGWPHKLYLNERYLGFGMVFYMVHLRDANEEQHKIITEACGFHVEFDTIAPGSILWKPC